MALAGALAVLTALMSDATAASGYTREVVTLTIRHDQRDFIRGLCEMGFDQPSAAFFGFDQH